VGNVAEHARDADDPANFLGNSQTTRSSDVVAPSRNAFPGRLKLLVDGGCISACEDFVEPLKDSGRATLVGETTQGSSGVPFFSDFHNGMSLKIAVKRYYFPDGAEFVGVGIKPDVEVHTTIEDLKNGRDPVLEKALERIRLHSTSTEGLKSPDYLRRRKERNYFLFCRPTARGLRRRIFL
jgi:C-terminal processing protease CtpA/Prc